MTLKSLPTLASAAALLAGFASGAAQAQQSPQPTQPTQPLQAEERARPSGALERGASVVDRPRPEYDPLGVRAGSFLIFPQVEAGLTWDSNVYAEPTDEVSDFLFEVSPAVTVRSDFSRHELRLRAGADIGRYFDETQQNYEDFLVEGTGRFDIATQTSATGRVGYRLDHEAGGDPDAPVGRVEPVEYDIALAEFGLEQGFGRFGVAAGASIERRNYDDVASRAGLIDQDFRDRTTYATTLRGSYEIQENFEAFVRGTYDWVEYREATSLRDSQGWEIAVGTDIDFTGLLTGSAYVGYASRDYDRAGLDDPSGISLGLEVDWAVTQLTTVSAEAARQFQETTSVTASSRQRTSVGVGVDHELLRNLILSADAAVRLDEFEGNNREDQYLLLGAGATYLLNRNYYLRGGYDFVTRDSDNPGGANLDYDRHLVTLRLGARL